MPAFSSYFLVPQFAFRSGTSVTHRHVFPVFTGIQAFFNTNGFEIGPPHLLIPHFILVPHRFAQTSVRQSENLCSIFKSNTYGLMPGIIVAIPATPVVNQPTFFRKTVAKMPERLKATRHSPALSWQNKFHRQFSGSARIASCEDVHNAPYDRYSSQKAHPGRRNSFQCFCRPSRLYIHTETKVSPNPAVRRKDWSSDKPVLPSRVSFAMPETLFRLFLHPLSPDVRLQKRGGVSFSPIIATGNW